MTSTDVSIFDYVTSLRRSQFQFVLKKSLQKETLFLSVFFEKFKFPSVLWPNEEVLSEHNFEFLFFCGEGVKKQRDTKV